jgi:hypothetical protein
MALVVVCVTAYLVPQNSGRGRSTTEVSRKRADSEPLAQELKSVFGENTTLGAKELECLLLLVMRNATRPVKVACVIEVWAASTKSSAVSVRTGPLSPVMCVASVL